jgi:hypothetical protein
METVGDRMMTRRISMLSPSESIVCSGCGAPYRVLLLGAHHLNCLLEICVPLEVKGQDRRKQATKERKQP